jgi:hypothetical protein
MKIGITGSTCSGKTTFLNYLGFNMEGLRQNIEIVTERAMECPYPLNDKGGFRTQWWIQSNHIIKEYEASLRSKIIITDRTVFDGIPYLEIAFHNNEELDFIIKTAENWNKIYPYDFVFYFAPIPLTNMNEYVKHKFQHEIDEKLRTIISYNINHDKIIYVPVQEKQKRCEDVFKTIQKLISENFK